MGTRLPDVTDYGQRPSLRSGRVDEAYFEGVEVADAVTQATTRLAGMYGEKREKDSRLEYALAKSELTKLDIQERDKLQDRQDWEAFDQDYQRGFATGADAIFNKYGKLSAEDRALLGAEADVIRERGRVYAGEMARTKETDWNRAEVNRTLTEFAEQVNLKQDNPLEQQQLMLDSLELVKAAEERGYFTEQEAEELMHSFVASTATNSLDYMEPEERLAAINASLAAREADGPITPDEIAAGGGSGSIGDFLPAHTLKKMQRETEKEIKIEDTQSRAYEAKDEAWRLYPGLDQDAERRAHIAKLLPGRENSEARKEAESLNRMARNDEVAAEGQVRARTVDELSAALRQYPDAQLSPKKLATLTDTEVEHLKRLQRQLREDQEWADATIWDAREAWDNLTPEQKASTDFDGTFTDSKGNKIPWKTAVHADRAEWMSADREAARKIVATKAAKGEDVKGVITPLREVEGWLVNTPLFDEKPTSASDEEDQQRWAMMIDRYNAAVHRRGGIDQLSEEQRKALFTEVMVNHVYIDEVGRDPYIPGIAVLPEEREDIYLPLTQSAVFLGKTVNPRTTKIEFPDPFNSNQTPEEWIRYQYYSATNSQRYPDEKEMQHLWALIVAEGPFAAYNRILDMTEDMRGGKPQGLNPSGP
jgi:hypothetical protein